MSKRRVVVTGIGIISPLGLTTQETWGNLLEGKSGVTRITRFDPAKFACQIAAEVKGFSPDAWIIKKDQKKMDLFIQYAVAAGKMAVADAGLVIDESNRDRVGIVVSAGMGGLPGIEEEHKTMLERGPGRLSPFFIPMVIPNMSSGHLAILTGARGPNLCITTACSTGAHSIGEAARYIQENRADVFIAGGSESVVCGLAIGGFGAMRALSTRNDAPEKASRPFDKDRDGFVMGEGGAVLILEELGYAQKRGARILCEFVGYGASCDAYHMTNPSEGGEGAARCMNLALEDAGLAPTDIDYINAHGTSTPAGDIAETMAIKTVFGRHAIDQKLWVGSTKSMTGHLLGAAGSLEAAFSVLSLRDNVAPPTINIENQDPACDLDYISGAARERRMNAVLSNSFGFGGTNASLIFRRMN